MTHPAITHLQHLIDAGHTPAAIERASGYSDQTIRRLLDGTHQPRRSTAQTILATTPAHIIRATPPKGMVPGTGARRRIQALMALGWTHQAMHDDLRAHGHHLHTRRILDRSKGDHVTRTTHDAILDLYDRLSMTLGPSEVARGRAARHGWAAPLAWDDANLDNHLATPAGRTTEQPELDDIAIERAITGDQVTLTRPERIEAIRRMTATGHSDSAIGTALHMDPNTILRLRRKHDIPTTRPTHTTPRGRIA